MEAQTSMPGVIFTEDFSHIYHERVLHILCIAGSVGFSFRHVRYNLISGDYAIITETTLASDFSISENFKGFIMWLEHDFIRRIAIRSNYDVVGKLSLMRNPVMKLTSSDFETCTADLQRLMLRNEGAGHIFHEELISHLLAAHILDLYDIHSRQTSDMTASERATNIMSGFISLLEAGEYRKSRELSFYASKLFITPHHLSDTSRDVSGKPAGYWIDRFAINDILRVLSSTDMPLTDVSEQFNFKSLSHFSRYFSSNVGMAPTRYRSSVNTDQKIKIR